MNTFLLITDPNHVLRAGIDQCRMTGEHETEWDWIIPYGYHGWTIAEALHCESQQEFRCVEEMHPTRMQRSEEHEESIKIVRDDRSNVEADRRFELIKEAMNALIIAGTFHCNGEEIADMAVEIADAVIKRMSVSFSQETEQ